MPTPTSVGFVDADYNRETGLVGNGSTKYLNTNAPVNTTCPFNNAHASVYVSTSATTGTGYIGQDSMSANTGEVGIYRNASDFTGRFQNADAYFTSRLSSSVGLVGISRSSGASMTFRSNSVTDTITYASAGNSSSVLNIAVFGRNLSAETNGRLAFYSLGESLDLALLDARVTTLISDIAAAIP
jgi:hypothetical protein